MGQIQVTHCEIEGLAIIQPTVHGDDRGYFMETYNQKDMQEAGLAMTFVQDNQSMSVKGVRVGCIIRSIIRRESWYVSFGVRFLMWPWICGKTPQPLVLGTGKYSLLKIRSNSIFLRALPTVFMYSATRQNLFTNARIFITLEMKAAFAGMIRRIGVNWPLLPGITPILSEKDKNNPFLGK